MAPPAAEPDRLSITGFADLLFRVGSGFCANARMADLLSFDDQMGLTPELSCAGHPATGFQEDCQHEHLPAASGVNGNRDWWTSDWPAHGIELRATRFRITDQAHRVCSGLFLNNAKTASQRFFAASPLAEVSGRTFHSMPCGGSQC